MEHGSNDLLSIYSMGNHDAMTIPTSSARGCGEVFSCPSITDVAVGCLLVNLVIYLASHCQLISNYLFSVVDYFAFEFLTKSYPRVNLIEYICSHIIVAIVLYWILVF